MPARFSSMAALACFLLLLSCGGMTVARGAPQVGFQTEGTALHIRIGDAPFATYVWQDDRVPRPYFARVCAPGGAQVTRNFPPDPEADRGNDDHATFHPGVWLAFGDISGADFWRLKARVRHQAFLAEPKGGEGVGTFAVDNIYETNDGEFICEEHCTYTVRVEDWGFLLISESTFRSQEGPFTFGDQEEMGLGVRLATGLTVRHGGGTIVNSGGGRDEAGTWGREATWCAGYGAVDGERLGAIVMADPANFRASWFHSRDYGLIVANPFGKKAMTAPTTDTVPPDATRVARSASFRLGYGMGFFRTSPTETPAFDAMYRGYLAHLDRR
jgi:hypothetical protein